MHYLYRTNCKTVWSQKTSNENLLDVNFQLFRHAIVENSSLIIARETYGTIYRDGKLLQFNIICLPDIRDEFGFLQCIHVSHT